MSGLKDFLSKTWSSFLQNISRRYVFADWKTAESLQRQLEAITVSFQQKSFCLLKDLPIQSKYFKEKTLQKEGKYGLFTIWVRTLYNFGIT